MSRKNWRRGSIAKSALRILAKTAAIGGGGEAAAAAAKIKRNISKA